MKVVKVGNEVIEFPADMPDADIERVLSQQFKTATPKKTDEQLRAEIGGGRLQAINPLSFVGIGPERIDLGVNLGQGTTEFLAGMGRRFMDIGTLGNRPTKDATADRLLDGSLNAAVGGAAADLSTLMGGGATIRAAGAARQMAPAVGNALRTVGQSMLAPQSVRAAATTAGLYGAATTNGDAFERARSGAINAAIGGAGQAIPMAVGRALSPQGNAGANAMRNAGVDLTPGQALGGRFDAAEQKLTSLPLVGDMIANARGRSTESFNVAAVNEALAPLGAKVPKNTSAGRELINRASDILDNAYDAVLPKMRAEYDAGLDAALNQAKALAANGNKAQQFESIVNDKLLSRFSSSNDLKADELKKAISQLGAEARKYATSADADQRTLGEALDAARQALSDAAKRFSPAEASKELAKTDAAYARFLRVQTAASRQGAKEGVFTPAQLTSAVREMSGGVRKSRFAKGNALMQDFASTGEATIGNTFPNSGTADRMLLGAGALGGLGYFLDPMYAAGLLSAAGLYSRPGQAAVSALMSPRTNPALIAAGRGAQQLAPYGGLLAAPLAPAIYAGQQ